MCIILLVSITAEIPWKIDAYPINTVFFDVACYKVKIEFD